MLRLALAALALAFAFCLLTPEHADAKVPGARSASIKTWGKVPCNGKIKVIPADLPGMQVGEARWMEDPVTNMRFRCVVLIDNRKVRSKRQRCQTLVHEFGHLLGKEHSERPRSVMFWKATPRNIPRVCR